jgi:GTP-binding protein
MIIKSATYVKSSPDLASCPPANLPEYAFIGRSNVGKSSLINMLCNNSKLAKTSATPGKTKLINHFLVNGNWYLVDLPGYGFAKVSQTERKKWEKMIENYLRQRENLVNVFVLIDSRLKPQKIDLDFINKLGEWEIPLSIVFTKADKETQKTVSENVKGFMNKLKETWQFLPAHYVTSAVKKMGRDKILDFIEETNTELKNRE